MSGTQGSAKHGGVHERPLWPLTALAMVSWLAYLVVACLSRQFVYGEGHAQRPIISVLGLFAVAFGCYLLALPAATRVRADRRLLGVIFGTGLLFRLTLLPSAPIQEIDAYRYLWDGAAAKAGVSPFRYSPQQVLRADDSCDLPDELARLVRRRDETPALATILSRIHYPTLPTVYPPVSQAVFAVAALASPREATVYQRLVIFKTFVVAFDLATFGLVLGLLKRTNRHIGWSLAYGWCPLVMKEFANSGHLDAIAVSLTTLAIYAAVCGLYPATKRTSSTGGQQALVLLAAALLGLAVGAKLYPLVLAPLLCAACYRRFTWRLAAASALVVALTTAVVLLPMIPTRAPMVGRGGNVADLSPPRTEPTADDDATSPQDPSAGLQAFLNLWEMNDFLFIIVVENLTPQDDSTSDSKAWFSVLPEQWRRSLLSGIAVGLRLDPGQAAFLVSRAITLLVFAGLACVLAFRGAKSRNPDDWLQAGFLTLAWFWLLAPTQNPWYWTWALPLLPFAGSRAWYAMSGLVLLYYLRFWLEYHWPDQAVPGSPYTGIVYFDFVVTWLEFFPWFVWLAAETIWRRFNARSARGVKD